MRLLLGVGLCVAFPLQAKAQWSFEDVTNRIAEDQPQEIKDKTGGLIDSVNAVNLSGFAFNVTENEKVVTAKLSSEVVSLFNDDRSAASSRSWDLNFSVPIDEESNIATATLDRMSSGTKAGVKYTFGETFDIKFGDNKFDAENFLSFYQNAILEAQSNCLKANEGKVKLKELCKVPLEGESDELDDFIKKHATSISRDNFQLYAKHIWVTASADLGWDNYEFLNADDLMKVSEEELAYKAGLAFSYTETKSPLIVSIGANFESAFEEADEMENCIGEGEEQNCVEGRLGAPERTDDWLAFTEVRRLINVDLGQVDQIGLAPRLTYNFSKGVTGVNLPIYFIKPEGGLSSGFQLGWRSDTDDVTAGIIVGGSFDFMSK